MVRADTDDADTSELHKVPRQLEDAGPTIDDLTDFDHLFNEGIIHNGYYYSIQTFPRIYSEFPIELQGFYKESSTNPQLSAHYRYLYDRFNPKEPQNRMQAPRDNYLQLNIFSQFESIMLGNVFAVKVTKKNSFLPPHYLIPRKTKLQEGRANAQQIEIAIREGKTKLASGMLQDRFDQLTKGFTDQQQAFVYKSLNIVDNPHDNYDVLEVVNPHLNSHAVIPFKDYLRSLKSDEKVKVLVGRGQLGSNHEFYNQPLSSSKVLPADYNPYTIDIDPRQIPHLVADITNLNHLSEIPDGSVDEFYFDGVTYQPVYNAISDLYNVLSRKLKMGGKFITNWGDLSAQKLSENGFGKIERLDPQKDYFNFPGVKSVTKIR